jgi:transcriptional regulator with XRE-family HTH domain
MDEAFSKSLATNIAARRKEVARRLGVARREAHLSQEVVADALAYAQSDISRMEAGTRLPDVVELENFAVLYEKPLDYFATWETELTRTSFGERQVLSEDLFQLRATAAKIKRSRRWKKYKARRL